MRVQAGVVRDDASAKRKLPDAAHDSPTTRGSSASAGAAATTATSKLKTATSAAAAKHRDEHSRYNYSNSGGRSKLQLQCSDGRVFDVTHEEAMMSSTLWMLLQDVADKKAKTMVKQHMIPIFDVPSTSVELALFYCRCLYKQQVEGHETALLAWDASFLQLDSKTLCDLAKVASHLDIQPLVDLTCRSIAQIMSATDAAHEIRQKFGLDDSPAAMECSCELRSGIAALDFDVFDTLEHDLSTEEYELVEFDQPSVDELVSFINGSGGSRPPKPGASTGGGTAKSSCHMHTSVSGGASLTGAAAAVEGQSGDPGASKKKNKKKKKKKKAALPQQLAASGSSSVVASTSTRAQENASRANAKSNPNSSSSNNSRESPAKRPSEKEEEQEDDDDDEEDSDAESSDSADARLPRDLQEKMRLARQNPSAIFCESQFEEDDEETQEQIESFRLALESAHLESSKSSKTRLKPRVKFAPQDVFRSTLVASQRHTSQRVSTAI